MVSESIAVSPVTLAPASPPPATPVAEAVIAPEPPPVVPPRFSADYLQNPAHRVSGARPADARAGPSADSRAGQRRRHPGADRAQDVERLPAPRPVRARRRSGTGNSSPRAKGTRRSPPGLSCPSPSRSTVDERAAATHRHRLRGAGAGRWPSRRRRRPRTRRCRR